MSGRKSSRFAVVAAMARSVLVLHVFHRLRDRIDRHLDLSGEQVRHEARAIGHVGEVDAGHLLQQLAEDVRRAAVAAGGIVDLARMGFGVGDELRHGFDRQRWIDHDEIGRVGDAADRRDVAHEIEFEVREERLVEHVRQHDHLQRVAVRRRGQRRLGGDVAGGARAVLDDELLAEPLRQPLPHRDAR